MLLIKVLLFFCYCFSSQSILLCLAPFSLGQAIQMNFENKRKHSDSANEGRKLGEAPNLKKRKTKKTYPCDVCQKTFSQRRHLVKHKRTHTGEKPYECEECHKTFSQDGNFLLHQRTHTGIKPYKCEFCQKQFIVRSPLIIHQRTHTGEKPYECDVCGRNFSQSGNLKKHKIIHDKEEFYECAFCDQIFIYEASCKKHQQKHLNKEEPYPCEFCHKKFVYERGWKKHQQKHPKKISYPCDGCEKTFGYSVFLKWHREKHVKEGKFFTKGSLLYLHTHIQKQERVFSCANEGCGKSFCTQLELFFHNVTIHIEKETSIEDLQIEFDMFFEALREGRLSLINQASFSLFFEDHNQRIKKLFERQSEENENDDSSKYLETKEEVKDWEFLLLGDILSLLLDVRWSDRNNIEEESRGVEKSFPENSFLLIDDKDFLKDMKSKTWTDSQFSLFLTILLDVFHVKTVPMKLSNILNKHMPNRSA